LVHAKDSDGGVLKEWGPWVKQKAVEVMSKMPEQVVRDGGRVDFGPPGNKRDAIHISSLLGHVFRPDCRSCESDLYYVIKNAAR
jgi:hypothetical protein